MRNLRFYLLGGAAALLLIAVVIVVCHALGYLVLALCGAGPGDLYYNSSWAFFMGVTVAIGIVAVCLIAGEIIAAVKALCEKGEEEKDED